MTIPANFELSPRQALIAAAITGYRGDSPSSWSSPASKEDILHWARSYHPNGCASDLLQAFDRLTADGCWTAIRYPIFAEPQYYCHYWSSFIDELPDPVASYIAADPETKVTTKPWLKAFWEDLFDRFSEEWGAAWLYWGLCAGQGSEGPSDGLWGPCLGPSCSWFQEGKPECNWSMKFQRVTNASYPSMNILHSLNHGQWADVDQDAFCEQTLVQIGFPIKTPKQPD